MRALTAETMDGSELVRVRVQITRVFLRGKRDERPCPRVIREDRDAERCTGPRKHDLACRVAARDAGRRNLDGSDRPGRPRLPQRVQKDDRRHRREGQSDA